MPTYARPRTRLTASITARTMLFGAGFVVALLVVSWPETAAAWRPACFDRCMTNCGMGAGYRGCAAQCRGRCSAPYGGPRRGRGLRP